MERTRTGIVAVFLLLGPAVLGQGLIGNGNFENWTNGWPDNWTKQGSVIATQAKGLDGTGFSVNLAKAGGDSDAISQLLSTPASSYFYVQFDFAFENPGTARAMDVTLKSGTLSSVHPRVNAGRIEFYGSATGTGAMAWQVLPGTEGQMLASNFATNSLVVYRIIIQGIWQDAYKVTVKNLTTNTTIVTEVPVDLWQSAGTTLTQIWLERGRSGANWRADNLMIFGQDPTIPVVNAGLSQQVMPPAGTVQMNPSVFDLDTAEGNFTYAWSQVSGPAASFSTVAGQTQNDPQAVISLDGGPGVYQFKLTVTDPEQHSGQDSVLVRAKDESDNVLLAHWAFEDQPQGQTVADSLDISLGNFAPDDGILGSLPQSSDPNSDPNWVSGWVGISALDFWDHQVADIQVNTSVDPNLANLQWEISLAGWIKPADIRLNTQNTVIARGNPFNWVLRTVDQAGTGIPVAQFTLGLESGNLFTEGNIPLNDGYWHHIAGTFDGTEVKLYVDGILDASQAAGSLLRIIPESQVTLGGRRDFLSSWTGLLDDIRVYSYGLSAEEVQNLVRLGKNAIPSVVIGDSVVTELIINFQDTIDLSAEIIDLNIAQGQQVYAEWTVTDPLLADKVQFGNAATANTTAKFLEPGVYTLRLTVRDEFGAGIEGEIFDEITILVKDAICTDLLILDPSSGLLKNPQLSFDVSGPADQPDCYVNLHDLVLFAQQWLLCNDPQGQGCQAIVK